jgi:hypothetical protein
MSVARYIHSIWVLKKFSEPLRELIGELYSKIGQLRISANCNENDVIIWHIKSRLVPR